MCVPSAVSVAIAIGGLLRSATQLPVRMCSRHEFGGGRREERN